MLGNILEALRTLGLKIIHKLVHSGWTMRFTVTTKVDGVLSLEKLVFIRRGVKRSHQLTGSSFIEVNLEVLVTGGTADLPPIGLNQLHLALLDLQDIANEYNLPIDREGHSKEAGLIDINLI